MNTAALPPVHAPTEEILVTLKVRIYRALDIDYSKAGRDDALLLHTERGTPIVLTFAQEPNSCMRRWSYEIEHMMPIDSRQVDEIVNAQLTPEERSTAIIKVYVPFKFHLDRALDCTVYASWPDEPYQKRRLGNFESGGRLVTNVSPIVLNPVHV